jgi:hypothetical protein
MSRPQIESYEFGRMVIDGRTYTQDLIILPERIVDGWWRQEGHVLHAADLEEVLKAGPDLLIVGQGANGRMQVAADAKEALREGGIDFSAMPTPQAVQRFNGAAPEDQAVAAAFHLTC